MSNRFAEFKESVGGQNHCWDNYPEGSTDKQRFRKVEKVKRFGGKQEKFQNMAGVPEGENSENEEETVSEVLMTENILEVIKNKIYRNWKSNF